MYVGGRSGNKPALVEKAATTAACERLIADVLRLRLLPEVRPSITFDYPVAIEDKWFGKKSRFFARYRLDRSLGEWFAIIQAIRCAVMWF